MILGIPNYSLSLIHDDDDKFSGEHKPVDLNHSIIRMV